jgi:hypothetical protein
VLNIPTDNFSYVRCLIGDGRKEDYRERKREKKWRGEYDRNGKMCISSSSLYFPSPTLIC